MLGQVLLGKYRVTRLLDQGGMCKIWLARQVGTQREVVIKTLHENLLSQPKPREFFRREIHILSRFRHPHAVGYVDAAPNQPGGPVLVLEYLRGIGLDALLHREGRLTPERAGRLLVQLCTALAAAHEAGIVHRDIKPGNLMVLNPCTPHETIKLMDFGLAKMTSLLYIGADDLADFTLPAACGTPEYIAPEQARGHDSDARGDLYSTGVVLYEMLTGRRPFERGSTEALLEAHAEEPPPRFAERGASHVPPGVEAVVRACLAKHPEERPRNADELARRYEEALGKRLAGSGRDGPALFHRPAPATQETTPRPPGTPVPASERHAVRQDFEADMPESMAMLKLKGFLHDLGSQVVESLPGMIRVRLGNPSPAKKPSGLFALLGGGASRPAAPPPDTAINMELRMERRDPGRPSLLHITLIMRPGGGPPTSEWRTRCQKIGLDLKAYLMGR